MPYEIIDPKDGERPAMQSVSEEKQLAENSVLLADEVVESAPPDAVWDVGAGELRDRTATEDLSHAKALKEAELRDAANSWYQQSVRGFEGSVVIHKIDRAQALNAEEQAIRDAMTANYTKLRNLIGQTRAATTVGEVEAVQWT